MRKNAEQVETKLSSLVKRTSINDILPFTENPPVNSQLNKNKEKNNELAASDLFSLFTADIIKEDVVFTR